MEVAGWQEWVQHVWGVQEVAGTVGKRGYSMCGEQRNTHRILVGKPKEKSKHGNSGRRWETILIRIVKKYDEILTELIWLMRGTSGTLL
jgi:hypothetical protein